MSKPSAGSYIIYNRVLSPTGQKLAITYPGGQNEALTVTPLSNTTNQIWILKDYNATTSSISPQSIPTDQIGWGDGSPVVLPPGGYVWTIKGSDTGYVIQDGGVTVFWSLPEATDKSKVSIGKEDDDVHARWIFERIST